MVASSDEEKSGVPTGAPGRSSERRQPGAADHTVLLVEDLDEHRYLYATVLRLAGYRVLEAADGERALALAREALPSLILLDMGLPVLDGWQVIQLLRANPATRAIPVIAVTVHAFPWDATRALELGCTLHMPKPVRPHDVLLAVHRVLGLLPSENPA
jgi:two-component system, cell cycle response regulator DivK